MRCFHSLLAGLVLGVWIPLVSPCWGAGDIEIEMDNAPAAAPKAAQPPSTSPAPSSAVSKPESTAPSSSAQPEEVEATTAVAKGAVVEHVRVSSEGSGSKVSVEGNALPRPTVQKISAGKILLKFAKTRLKIPAKMSTEDEIVKSVRSSRHPGAAWVVFDVKGVKQWHLEKSDSGYSLILNEAQGAPPASGSGEEALSSPSEKNETGDKGLFSRLIDASIKPLDNGIKLVLTADGPSKYTLRKISQPEKIVVHFHETKLEIANKTQKFKDGDPALQKGGLLAMEFRQIGPAFSPISEMMLTVLPGTTYQLDRDLNQVVLTLTAPTTGQKTAEKKGNLNQLISMDLEGADLNAVLKTLAAESGFELNLVAGPVTGTVNEKFKDIPLKTVLADILTPGSYAYSIQGNSMLAGPVSSMVALKSNLPRVTELIAPGGGMTPAQMDTMVRPLLSPGNAVLFEPDTIRNMSVLTGTASDIEDYKRAIKDLKLDAGTEGSRIIRVVKLNYADPAYLQTILKNYLTPAGDIQVVTNSAAGGPNASGIPSNSFKLVIRETASNMGTLLELINELDRKPPQVLIESNIVEVDNEADLNLGVVWGLNKANGDPTVSGGVTLPPNNAINPGAISFGTIKAGININATLEALETHKKGRIVSRPRVATTNGVLAEINETENVVVQVANITFSNGVQNTVFTFTQLGLPIDLKVTPRITDEGTITSQIAVSITSQTGQPVGQGPPPTSIQTATTTVNTKNGETIVIGGLVRETVQDAHSGIPILSSLPIIGTLFQENDKQKKTEELVIFITPTLLKD